jgi:hypothetical protein
VLLQPSIRLVRIEASLDVRSETLDQVFDRRGVRRKRTAASSGRSRGPVMCLFYVHGMLAVIL